MSARSQEETGKLNRRLVLGEILKNRAISRTEIATNLGLNAASISRITRDLIDADLIVEKELSEPCGRRGRRFVQLSPVAEGGFIIGVGINAFRQSVTLADLENNKIASWEATGMPVNDGPTFLRLCAKKAARLVRENVPDESRFFGAGLAIAGHIDKKSKVLKSAPIMGWNSEVDVASIFAEHLGGPIALETPSAAINLAETTFGMASEFRSTITLHCSLVTGIGMTIKGDGDGGTLNSSSVLSDAPYTCTSHTSGLIEQFPTLEDALSGRSFVRKLLGSRAEKLSNDSEWGREIVSLVEQGNAGDPKISEALLSLGAEYARYFSLLFSVLQPQLIILAGPLSESPEFVQGMRDQVRFQTPSRMEEVQVQATKMTHIGAARWLSIRENLIFRDINLSHLLAKGGT